MEELVSVLMEKEEIEDFKKKFVSFGTIGWERHLFVRAAYQRIHNFWEVFIWLREFQIDNLKHRKPWTSKTVKYMVKKIKPKSAFLFLLYFEVTQKTFPLRHS